MNYRHAFHAGNHADVLKHVVMLALLKRLQAKPGGLFLLDTHGGRGLYALDEGSAASRTGEWREGVARLNGNDRALPAAVADYLAALAAWYPQAQQYPGSPLLLAASMRPQDRLAACEVQAEEAAALRQTLRPYAAAGVHQRDGYEALLALTPPPEKRGLVLIDPPYETQVDEFTPVQRSLRGALSRWPQGVFVLWYPIKQRILLRPVMRVLARLPAKSLLQVELLVRPDDSPLRLNGSGLLLVNPPWQIEQHLAPALDYLQMRLGGTGASSALHWLKAEAL
jgi:23S rRNA (adenine2030-N6)-methyltransferase